MKNAVLKFIAIAAMPVVAGMTAAQAQTTAGPNSPATAAQAQTTAGPKRPAAVPQGYVITPFGYFHPTCVLHLAKGDELRADEDVIRHANGATSQIPACAYPHYRADGERVMGDERGVTDPDIGHSWVIDASVTTTSSPGRFYKSFGFLYGEWSVPPAPASNDGQTLYYFNGMEQLNDVVTIIQPVLGWNSDFASAWGIASWNCCEKGTTVEATPVQVNSGDTILGYMFDTCATGTKSCASWDIVTWDLQNDQYSELLMSPSSGQTFTWAFAGVLEVYNIVQCSDYPNPPNGTSGGSHAISFNDTALYDAEFVQVDPRWSVYVTPGLSPQCGYGGSLPQQVILYF